MPQTGEIRVAVASKLTATSDLSTAKDELNLEYAVALANGTGLGQANQVFHDRRTVNSGATDSLDLAGALVNTLGTTLTFTKIKGVIVYALPANTGNLGVARPASNGAPIFAAASDGLTLAPGGLFVLANPSAAGIAVTPATGDLFDITNGTGTQQSYEIVIFGTV